MGNCTSSAELPDQLPKSTGVREFTLASYCVLTTFSTVGNLLIVVVFVTAKHVGAAKFFIIASALGDTSFM